MKKILMGGMILLFVVVFFTIDVHAQSTIVGRGRRSRMKVPTRGKINPISKYSKREAPTSARLPNFCSNPRIRSVINVRMT